MDIIYDHEAAHSISEVLKHSSNGGLNQRGSLPPLSNPHFLILKIQQPPWIPDGQIFRKFIHFCPSSTSNDIFD